MLHNVESQKVYSFEFVKKDECCAVCNLYQDKVKRGKENNKAIYRIEEDGGGTIANFQPEKNGYFPQYCQFFAYFRAFLPIFDVYQ